MKLLIIDPSTERRTALRSLFMEANADVQEVVGVGTTSDAFRQLQTGSFDGVFIFSVTISFHWLQLLIDLRNLYDYDTLPIIVMSELPTKQAVVDAYQAGANGVLVHPCPVENLQKTFRLIKAPIKKN